MVTITSICFMGDPNHEEDSHWGDPVFNNFGMKVVVPVEKGLPSYRVEHFRAKDNIKQI